MSTGGRVFPSVTGGGITRAGEAILQAVLAKSARNLASRELDIQERTNALNQFTTLVGFADPGTTLGQLGPGAMQLFGQAFGIPSDGLEDLVVNRKTIQTALDASGVDVLETDPALLNPAVRVFLGLPATEEELEAGRASADLTVESVRQLLKNPNYVTELVRRQVGQSPTQVRIPGRDGQPDRFVEFDTERAAQIYADFLMQQEGFEFELGKLGAGDMSALIEEIRGAVKDANFNVSSAALVSSVFPVYEAAASTGDPTPIIEFMEGPASEGEKLALQYLVGSIGLGADAMIRNNSPRMANFLQIAKELEGAFGAERAAEVLPSVLRGLGGSQFGQISDEPFFGPQVEVETGRGPSGFWSRLGQFLGARPPGPERPAAAGTGVTTPFSNYNDISPEIIGAAVIPAVEAGEMTEAEARAVIGPALGDQIFGHEDRSNKAPSETIDPQSVSAPFRPLVSRLNKLIVIRDNMKSPTAKARLDKEIQRLRDQINRGVQGR